MPRMIFVQYTLQHLNCCALKPRCLVFITHCMMCVCVTCFKETVAYQLALLLI